MRDCRSASPTAAATGSSRRTSVRTSSGSRRPTGGSPTGWPSTSMPKGVKLALLHDDTSYGEKGSEALDQRVRQNPEAVALRIGVSAGSTDLSPADPPRAPRRRDCVARLGRRGDDRERRSIAARSAGWNVPIYAPPRRRTRSCGSSSPTARWLDGLTIATGRMTAELGPTFFTRLPGEVPGGVRRPARSAFAPAAARRSSRRRTTRCTRTTS